MGLSLEVGLLADLRESDPDGYIHLRQQFTAINLALEQAGLPFHHEPDVLMPEQIWSRAMYGYAGLHYLRRVAAHLGAGHLLPSPGNDAALRADAVLASVQQQRHLSRFEHLILHEDDQGFYLPTAFEQVLYPDPALGIDSRSLGSSAKLQSECLELAHALEIPDDLLNEGAALMQGIRSSGLLMAEGELARTLHLPPAAAQHYAPLWAGIEAQAEGYVVPSMPHWAQYGVESYSCLLLLAGAKKSLEVGAALMFC